MVHRLLVVVTSVALLLVTAALAFWAGGTAVVPPQIPTDTHETQTYEVADGFVSRSFQVPVTARWPVERTAFSAADGVVTSVPHVAGEPANSGDTIATINLEPVVVAEGAVPMFRVLKTGVNGPDVAQFQEFLRAKGYLTGPADGRFGRATEAAAARWQRSVGAKRGAVAPGSLLFVEDLPARTSVLPSVGERTGIGSEFVRILADSPDFSATVATSQRSELVSGMPIAVSSPDGGTWLGRLGIFRPTDDGRFAVTIDGDVCRTECGAIAVEGESALVGTIVTVPETHGPVIPTSAIVQEPSGALAVTLGDGSRRQVEVVAEANGFAVVNGVRAGDTVQLPGPPLE